MCQWSHLVVGNAQCLFEVPAADAITFPCVDRKSDADVEVLIKMETFCAGYTFIKPVLDELALVDLRQTGEMIPENLNIPLRVVFPSTTPFFLTASGDFAFLQGNLIGQPR